MRRLILITFLIAPPFFNGVVQASGKTLASTLEVYVFPTEGQAADQQSKDEAACYSWAASNTGSDPFELQKQGDHPMCRSPVNCCASIYWRTNFRIQ